MSDALRFEGVRKRYGRGGVQALDSLSCHFPAGRICGLVGPNGAGKTTTFSVVSGFLRPDAGAVDVLGGGPFDPWRLKGRLGVLPQDAELPDRHSPSELLEHLARLQGLSARAARSEADRVLSLVQLDDKRRARIATLSHGMRRRVAVASALVGSPELVLLDEPSAGLDPAQARALHTALDALRGQQTLIVSSHDLDALERLCDWVVMLEHGRCVAQGNLAEVTGQRQLSSWLLGPGEVPLEALRAALPADQLTLQGRTLRHSADSEQQLDAGAVVLMRLLAAAGVSVRELRRGVGLEERFFAGDGAAEAPEAERAP